jgi:hypothetical protein
LQGKDLTTMPKRGPFWSSSRSAVRSVRVCVALRVGLTSARPRSGVWSERSDGRADQSAHR